jgi:hypothetical protein
MVQERCELHMSSGKVIKLKKSYSEVRAMIERTRARRDPFLEIDDVVGKKYAITISNINYVIKSE